MHIDSQRHKLQCSSWFITVMIGYSLKRMLNNGVKVWPNWSQMRMEHYSSVNYFHKRNNAFRMASLILILCVYCFIRTVTSHAQFNCISLVKNRTRIEVRRGSYTPSVWNPKPDDAIRKCNQLCNSVSRQLHGWRVVFWFVWVLWQAVLFKTAHVEEHEGSGVESGDRREGVVQYAHPVRQSSVCGNSLQG